MLSQAPRRVPASLSLRIMLGGVTAQGGWLGLAFVMWVAAGMTINRRGKPPGADDMHIAWILPVVAVALIPIAIAMVRSARHLRLLARGVQTHGKLVSKREVENSDTSYWHYTFEYKTQAGTTHRAVVITDTPEKALEDDAMEPMVYDPDNADVATTLDHLPGAPQIRDGHLAPRGGGALLVVVPCIAVAGIVATVCAVIV